jgi:hypothetical protein
MKGRDTYMISQLRQKIRGLENEKMILEKKLKFKSIIGDMRSSTKNQEEEIFYLKKQILELQKENRKLKQSSSFGLNNGDINEELKTVQKMLKNEKKMHEADIAVLSNLQSVMRLPLKELIGRIIKTSRPRTSF